jgi:hypothetical protein
MDIKDLVCRANAGVLLDICARCSRSAGETEKTAKLCLTGTYLEREIFLAIRRSPLTLPGNTAEELAGPFRQRGNNADRELDPRDHFRANSLSPAVRVCCGVVVGPTSHGTTVEFLPRFPALQKPVAIFQL